MVGAPIKQMTQATKELFKFLALPVFKVDKLSGWRHLVAAAAVGQRRQLGRGGSWAAALRRQKIFNIFSSPSAIKVFSQKFSRSVDTKVFFAPFFKKLSKYFILL